MIKYSLRPNRFTEDPNDQLANVEHSGTATLDDIVAQMTLEGGAIKESEARSSILEFFKAVQYQLTLGRSVSLEFLKLRFSLSGVFTDTDDSFDASRHQLNLKITPGSFLKKTLADLSLTKVKADTVGVEIARIYDFMSKTTDETITSGGMVRVLGEHLRIDAEDAEQGIYLIGDDSETKVEFYQSITLGELMFQAPTGLTPGSYALEIRTRIRNQKDLSTGRFDDLTVV